MVIVMTVVPGFGGQSLRSEINKITELANIRKERNLIMKSKLTEV